MKKNTAIRALEKKAEQKDIKALFQLAQYYEEGEFVTKNTEQATKYYAEVFELCQSQYLQITSIKLIDFRSFNKLDIDFCYKRSEFEGSSNLTVIIGDNGSGKSTILDALSKSLSWLMKKIIREDGKGWFIDQLDINNEQSVAYATVISNILRAENTKFKLSLSTGKNGVAKPPKNSFLDISQLAAMYRHSHSKIDQFNLPIIAFYSVKRAMDITKSETSEVKTQGRNWDKFDGYDNALSEKADFDLFFAWFKYLYERHNAAIVRKQKIAEQQAELNAFIELMQQQSGAENKPNKALLSLKQKKQQELKKLQLIDDTDVSSDILQTVTEVIYKFISISNLRMDDASGLKMILDKDNITLDILQLSQGEKSLLALVADIARRLVLLNPSLEDPLKGSGIVLIDEIDLHLHPAWQQTVIPQLLATFPNIQFIITTHSPQVLSTVDAQCIRILKDGKIYNSPKGSKGAESSRILKRFFEVEIRPKNDTNTLALKEYKQLVYSDQWNSDKAKILRKILNEQFAGEEPDLIALDLYIENRLWEIEIEED